MVAEGVNQRNSDQMRIKYDAHFRTYDQTQIKELEFFKHKGKNSISEILNKSNHYYFLLGSLGLYLYISKLHENKSNKSNKLNKLNKSNKSNKFNKSNISNFDRHGHVTP